MLPLLIGLVGLIVPPPLSGQRAPTGVVFPSALPTVPEPPAAVERSLSEVWPGWLAEERRTPRPAGDLRPLPALALSSLLPGAGQWRMGQARAWMYLGIEAAAWWLVLDRNARGGQRREAYRDLAWMEARGGEGARLDGDFEYYERLSHYERSGAFDGDPLTAGIQPEPDPSTFNGGIWLLARQLAGGPGPVEPGTPAFEQALAYYRDRAYDERFLWDWTGKGAERDRYRSLIRESDEAFRTAGLAVGAVVANHLVAGLDAFLAARGPLGLSSALSWTKRPAGAASPRATIALRWGLP